jgi:hypothetical protein
VSYPSRVTLDIDGHIPNFELRAIRAWHALERVAAETSVSISASGTGLHLQGWFSERLSASEKERIRRNLGDDPNRIELDRVRGEVGHTTNVLWTQKDGQEPDDDFETVYDALDAINRAQPVTARLRETVQRGLLR